MANDGKVLDPEEEKKLDAALSKSDDDSQADAGNEDNVNDHEHGDEENRIAEMKAAEEKRIVREKASEEARIAEAKAAEETRIVEEKAAEELRIAEEKAAEETRIAEEKASEETRIAEERAVEELRIAEEKAAEETRIAEETAAEAIRVAEEKEKAREVGEKASKEKAAGDGLIVDDKTDEYSTIKATELTLEGSSEVPDNFKSPKATSSATTPRTAPLTDETTPSTKSNSTDQQPKEQLPNENIQVAGRRLSNPSPQVRKLSFSPLESPSYVPKSAKSSRLSLPQIDPKLLPPLESKASQKELNPEEYKEKIKSIRARFEKKASEGGSSLVFGEAFREKKRTETIAEKHNKQAAISQQRGFDVFNQGEKNEMGEVDTSHLPKTFVFEGSGEDAHGGISLVDYKNNKYAGYAFLVHPSRGKIVAMV